jgi:4-hydroxy-L-threonine phosphate dehydrogenase PdxA
MGALPPVIAISLGDPGGIGPEIVAALSQDPEVLSKARLLCFGDRGALLDGARARGISGAAWLRGASGEGARAPGK